MRPRRLRDLAGLNVFLTGAASGIGRATAEAAAARGARLFLTDLQDGLLQATVSDYEFNHHQLLGRRAGLDAGDIERVRLGSTAAGWSDRQSLLLLEHRDLDDHLWAELRAAEDERTTIELVMLVGHYDMLATTLNTLRVQPETPPKGGGQ